MTETTIKRKKRRHTPIHTLGSIGLAILNYWGIQNEVLVKVIPNPSNWHECKIVISRGGLTVARKFDDSEEMTMGGFQSCLNRMLEELNRKEK